MNNQATIEDLLDELYDILDKGWSLPLSGGKVFVDGEDVKQLLEEIRDVIPDEIRQARAIVEERDQIISQAQQQAAQIKSKASSDIEMEKKKAINDAKNEISDLAMAIAGKVVERELNTDDQSALIDRFINELGDGV